MSIFISYKRVDKQRVFEIKRLIEENTGQSCWIDIDGIESDAQFVSVIMRAINECELFLFMYSKAHSEITDFERDWTVREIMFAHKKKKRIVFVNIDGAELADWFEFMFGTKQPVNSQDEGTLKRLCVDIKKWLNLSVAEGDSVQKKVAVKDTTSVGPNANVDDEQDNHNITGHADKASEDILEQFLVPYMQKGKWGYIDKNTKELVVKCKYDAAYKFSEGFACVMLRGKWGFIDKTGVEVVRCQYDAAYDFSGGFARVELNGEHSVIDKRAITVGNVADKATGNAKRHLVPYMQKGKWGYIDKNTEELVVKCKYDAAYKFSEGFACVMLRGKWGFIDKTGVEVVRCQYDAAYDFRGGIARVELNGESGCVDKFGNCTLDK